MKEFMRSSDQLIFSLPFLPLIAASKGDNVFAYLGRTLEMNLNAPINDLRAVTVSGGLIVDSADIL